LQTNVQNKIKVWACRFNDLNQKKKINKHPEKNVTLIDFFVSFWILTNTIVFGLIFFPVGL